MAQEKIEAKKDKTLTNLNLVMSKEIYERIKAVSVLKNMTVGQAFNEAGKLLIAQFDKESENYLREIESLKEP